MKRIIQIIFCSLICVITAQAQRGAGDWMTENGDAQRTAWIKADAKINKDSLAKPGFQFLWKMKLNNPPREMNNLTSPATLERLIGYRGFRMLGFVAGSGDILFTIDTDLGRKEWEKKLKTRAAAGAGTPACSGGMTTGVVRPTTAAISPVAGPSGPGRYTPAKSTVGEPGAGATTLMAVRPNPQPPPGPPRPNQAGRPGGPGGGPPRGSPTLIYALASDGMLHAMHLSNGEDFQPPIKFLPPGANANGLIVVDGVAYVATEEGCGGVANGVWALDLETKQVTNWKANVVGTAGPAFGSDGTLYVATRSGGESSSSIVALEAKTLRVKWRYLGKREFSSTPVIFEYKGKAMLVAAAVDGSMRLLDAENSTALFATPPSTVDIAPGALASWQDPDGTRWILAAHMGALPPGFKATEGVSPKGAILAWKLVEANGQFALQPGWASRNLDAPLIPTIINGVVFATASGEFRTNDGNVTAAMRAARSGRAVIYGLDGATGKELWNSGATITSFASGGALSGGVGQIYLTTYDGVVYAFGFPIEH